MENIIEIENLNKRFKEVHAVNNLSFKVKKGELFAFLGVNGAGKSTTISIMCGTLKKDSGSAKICGLDIDKNMPEITKKIGVVFQNSVLDKQLSVKDNLVSRASLYNICGKEANQRINELASLLGFEDLLSRMVGKLSGGQRRKIDVARALIHNPEILILDEPTTGLDPQTRKTMWKVINHLKSEQKMTIFLTTHYMEETSDADYVVILDKGKIASEGTPTQLKNDFSCDTISIYNAKKEDVEKLGVEFEEVAGGFQIKVDSTEIARDLIAGHPEVFKDFEVVKGKMDDVFLAVTGKTLEDE